MNSLENKLSRSSPQTSWKLKVGPRFIIGATNQTVQFPFGFPFFLSFRINKTKKKVSNSEKKSSDLTQHCTQNVNVHAIEMRYICLYKNECWFSFFLTTFHIHLFNLQWVHSTDISAWQFSKCWSHTAVIICLYHLLTTDAFLPIVSRTLSSRVSFVLAFSTKEG